MGQSGELYGKTPKNKDVTIRKMRALIKVFRNPYFLGIIAFLLILAATDASFLPVWFEKYAWTGFVYFFFYAFPTAVVVGVLILLFEIIKWLLKK